MNVVNIVCMGRAEFGITRIACVIDKLRRGRALTVEPLHRLFVDYCRLCVDCIWIVCHWHILYEHAPNFELPTRGLRRIPVVRRGPAARRRWPPAPCAAAANRSIASQTIQQARSQERGGPPPHGEGAPGDDLRQA